MNSLKLILSNQKYFAPVWVLASLNILTGTWVLYLPYIKTKFGLNDGEIGVALFCLALGLLSSIPFIPLINKKIGVGRGTQVGTLLYALAFNLPLLAPSYVLLCSGLFIIGITTGFTDVSANALISTVERKDNKTFMSAAHGFFSLGGFIGAGIGSVLIGLIATPAVHMAIIAVFIFSSNLFLSQQYQHIKEDIQEETSANKWKSLSPLLGLSIIAFMILFNEGAVEHWSNLFLFDIVKVTESQAGLGFIAFSLTMTIGRFLGDGISEQIGSISIMAYGCLIAAGAYLLILTANLWLSVLGFGVLGLGLSVIVPELFRLAGNTKGVQSSTGISIVSGVGFAGFLMGPVILGFISNAASLIASYVFLLVSVITIVLLIQFQLKGRYR